MIRASEVSLTFSLEGAGWASLSIKQDSTHHAIRGLSYLTDALDDLLRCGIGIATGRSYACASFAMEPGSHVLVAESGWWEGSDWKVGARLSAFYMNEDGEPLWQTIHSAKRDWVVHAPSCDNLANAIANCAEAVLEKHGVDGYRELWQGRLGFPMRGLTALRAALSIDEEVVEPYS
jgi:hypothetical protein